MRAVNECGVASLEEWGTQLQKWVDHRPRHNPLKNNCTEVTFNSRKNSVTLATAL